MSRDENDHFDLFEEIARGCLYRGGKDMQTFLNGYAWGAIMFGILVVALFLIGILKGY